MVNTIEDLKSIGPLLNYEWAIVRDDPNYYLVEFASKRDIDWIVIGTKGLTNIKELTVGSVANYCIQNSLKPVFAIPPDSKFEDMKTVVLGIEDSIMDDSKSLDPLLTIARMSSINIHLAHVKEASDIRQDIKSGYAEIFAPLNFSYTELEYNKSISQSLSKYCNEIDADLMCVIHKQRGWISSIFHNSISRNKLFDLQIPTLILKE